RLVDLDDTDSRLLQVNNLVAEGECDLPAHLAAWQVVAYERPLQHGDRTGQHAFHWAPGQRLGIDRPGDRHRTRPGDVAKDDRRAHAARAIALNPAMLGEGVAGELLAEILDHVVALELAMHQ